MGRFRIFEGEASRAVNHCLNLTKENLGRASKESITKIKRRENKRAITASVSG